jgi:hypothetical protein
MRGNNITRRALRVQAALRGGEAPHRTAGCFPSNCLRLADHEGKPERRTSQITEAGARDDTEIKIYLGLLHWNPPRVVSMIAAVIALLPLEDVAARDPARRVRTHGWQDGPSFEINGFVIKKGLGPE